jgi:phosphoribosylglycinamide formyltransferase-1
MMRLAFLASNNGSSLRAIVAAARAGALAVEPVLVISNRNTSAALDFARAHAIPAHHVPTLPDPISADERLSQILEAANVDLVILSGYLRKLGGQTLAAFSGRILNIHPALLPRHGGQGMYGRRVHEAVLAAGERVTGASVHLVDQEYDHGPVLASVKVPVEANDTAQSLEAKVMALEPSLFVDTIKRIVSGELPLMAKGAAT